MSNCKLREAKEVFLRINPDRRMSRMARAEWILEHLNGTVGLAKDTNEHLSVCGIIPRDSAGLGTGEELKVTSQTTVTFLANAYRIVFVIDLSPSSFVIDDLGCVLYSRLIDAVVKCLRSLAKQLQIPGNTTSCPPPKIWLSFCAFSPFLCFSASQSVLIQGVLFSPKSLDQLISQLLGQIKQFIDQLVLFSQPHIREWSMEQRRARRGGTEPQQSNGQAKKVNGVAGTDRGFIHSDWALIFMLRMGLLSAQTMLPRSLANIVIVTDGVCGVFDHQALQGVLAQLRLNCVSCSFIQLRSASLCGPVLGHVGFPELFQFIAIATLGTHLFEDQLGRTRSGDPLDTVQRALLCWGFQKGGRIGSESRGKSPPLPLQMGCEEPRTNLMRNKRWSRTYEASLANLLAIRLREGYSILQLEGLPQQHQSEELNAATMLLIRLSLAWRPLINIEYVICAPRRNNDRRCKLHVDVFVETQLHSSMTNLLGDRQDPNSLRTALANLNEADALALHLDLFNSETHYWDLPKEVDRMAAIFDFKRASQRIVLAERYEALRSSKFVTFWQPLSSIDDSIWQKWMHTHTVRILLAHDHPLPERLFTPQGKGRFAQASAEMAFNVLHTHLKHWASFALLRDRAYVFILRRDWHVDKSPTKRGDISPPDNFCLMRTSMELPFVLARLSFPGGVSGQMRDAVLGHFLESLRQLHIAREIQLVQAQPNEAPIGIPFVTRTENVPSLCVVQMPFERLLVRYRSLPRDLHNIVRLERTDSETDKRDMVIHNAIAKFLSCRRQVWRFRGVFFKNTVAFCTLEFTLQTLLRLRLHQGFQLSHCRNGIATLVREALAQKLGTGGQMPVLEQCVLFGPTMVDGGSEAKQRKSSMGEGDNNNTAPGGGLGMTAERYGTLESGKSGPTAVNTHCPQIVTEVWSEPTRQTTSEDHGTLLEQRREALLAENALVVRTLFSFDQLMSACNSRLWAEKPFLLETATGQRKSDDYANSTDVQFIDDTFELGALFQHATQRQMMLLPAMGFADCDPHSLTRLSFLLKGLQQELAEHCDLCIELADDAAFTLFADLEQCFGEKGDEIDLNPAQEEGPGCGRDGNFMMPADKDGGGTPFSEVDARVDNGSQEQAVVETKDFCHHPMTSQRCTSVPLLNPPTGAKGVSPTKHRPHLIPFNVFASSSNVAKMNPQNAKVMLEPPRTDVNEPRKKLSAPANSAAFSAVQRDSQQKGSLQQSGTKRTMRVYAKRLNDWRLMIFVVAKDARVCRQMMHRRRPNTFPVLAFMCDKPRMAQHFVEHTKDGKTEREGPQWAVEVFETRRPSVARRTSLVGTERQNKAQPMDAYFLSGCLASANEDLLETELSELAVLWGAPFELSDHCAAVFEGHLFTKALVATAYACLCQELFVPIPVLVEAMQHRCEHTGIEIGAINEILRDTCAHLTTGNESVSSPRKRKRPYSVSSNTSTASSLAEEFSPSKRVTTSLRLPSSQGCSSGEDTLVMSEVGQFSGGMLDGSSRQTATVHCHDQLDDFRTAFDQLLPKHNFHRVPGLADYFFYRPNREDQSMSAMNLPGLEEYVQIGIPSPLSSPSEYAKAGPNFSRHSSTRKEKSGAARARKSSTSAASLVDKHQRRSTAPAEEQREDTGPMRRSRSSSTASWELEQEEGGQQDSEKSSLVGELFQAEHWPLFIQFSVTVQLPGGQRDTSPVEFIPNCFNQILEKCPPLRVHLAQEEEPTGRCELLEQLDVRINMCVLTWPLPGHEAQHETERNLGELFGGSGATDEWLLSGARNQQSGDEIFERKVEMLRQIPAEERRLLRKLQRNVQKMLKTEHMLITSRAFESRGDSRFGTMLRVIQFIRDEVQGSAGAGSHIGTEQTLARFEMLNRELVLVAEQEDGLRRLGEKLAGLRVDYCRLRALPRDSSTSSPGQISFEMESLAEGTRMLFYSCGVDDLGMFVRTRHESIRQIGSSFKRVPMVGDPDGEVASILAKELEREEQTETTGGGIEMKEGEEEDSEEEEEVEEEDEEEREGFCNSSTTVDDGSTIAELTMPLNDSCDFEQFQLDNVINNKNNNNSNEGKRTSEGREPPLEESRNSLFERKQLLHDFWLIVQVEQEGDALSVNIYFCQRKFLLHDQLFESACRLVEEQIRLVNQELLLEKMHQTEECDQLLMDHDFHPHQPHKGMLTGQQQHSLLESSGAASRSAQNVPGETALARHARFAHRPSSLLVDGDASAVPTIVTASHMRNNSLTFSDEEGEHSAEVSELARYKFRPGHFACDMVWYHWFPIHPRLQPSRSFSGANDIGFKALRLGLEGLAVRNRSNMYVYKESNSNVVYMRLHATEESILANIPAHSPQWEEEVRQNAMHCILLAAHGVRVPGEEITEQLMSVLQRRLNSRTLEEIQNALLKNAHIRLEWSDIRFIQREPEQPSSVFFFTVPLVAQRYLSSVKYYLSQQMLTFCISPKFREQSGANSSHHGSRRSKYSGGAGNHFFSGGGCASRALSLAGTPTIEYYQWGQRTSERDTPMPTTAQHHTFVPYCLENGPPNPPNYVPTFYLVNKPPGEGKRDTGIACLEVKLIDWEGKLLELAEEGHLDAESHLLLYPGCQGEWARLNELSKCVQVPQIGTGRPVPNTCALFQFNMWQNGNVGVDELQARLKMCVQQAICDLVTEFGLLSVPLFESMSTPVRSKAGSLTICPSHPTGTLKLCSSELPIPNAVVQVSEQQNALSTNIAVSSAPIQSPVKPRAMAEGTTLTHHHPPPLRHPVTLPLLSRPSNRQLQSPVPFASQQKLPSLPSVAPAQQLQHEQQQQTSTTGEYLNAEFVAAADQWFSHVINETRRSPEMSHSVRKCQFRLDCDGSAKKIVQVIEERLGTLLRSERLVVCRSVAETPSHKRLQTLRSVTSLLDPSEKDLGRPVRDAGGREPLELALLAFNEQLMQDTLRLGLESAAHSTDISKLAEHSHVSSRPVSELAAQGRARCERASVPSGGGQQQQESCNWLDEEEEVRIWRSSQEPMQMFARRMSCVSSLGCWRSAAAAAVAATNNHLRAAALGADHSHRHQANSPLSSSARTSLSKFLPCVKPFIPRQRLLYLLIQGETISLFLYNYQNDVVAKIWGIVERTTLWHNARSRLLREIGLHKMGITHLSTLKSTDAKFNSYLLLTWMDPETLVNNDYPVDALTTPDFSNIPRIYAQLLLKLFRFADPAFVAKHISPSSPFEDQTEQMLALRRVVRSMLNDHRVYTEVHNSLIEHTDASNSEGRRQKWSLSAGMGLALSEEVLLQLVSRCHEVHFVLSPLLLFPSWRRRVAAIRMGAAADPQLGLSQCRKHSFQSVHLFQANAKTIKGPVSGKGMVQLPPGPPAAGSPSHRCSIGADEEPCLLRIQQMLVEDYVAYLRSIDLSVLHIERTSELPHPLQSAAAVHEHHLSSGSQGSGSVSLHPLHHAHQSANAGPEVWLCRAMDGGILFVHLSFMAPFFCLRILQWNAAPQLDEHLRPNQQQKKSCSRLEDQVHSVRALEHAKNKLVRQCHVHSFVYDFHLRMVARYLVGEKQVLFNPGYNTNAFLVDFLQYYACRPTNARNCVYEEIVHCGELQVSAASIWEHFLSNEQRYGWKVIRLKIVDAADEFMLIAKETRKAFGLDYELIRVVINLTKGQQQKGLGSQITLKLYVLLVTEMTAPFVPAEQGSVSTEHKSEELKNSSECLGEFTQFVVNNNAIARPEGPQSPCSTLIEHPTMTERDGECYLESFEEDEGRDDDEEEIEAEDDECRERAETVGESTLASLAPIPLHRQRSATSTSSRQSLSRRPIVPSQLAQRDYCYECVIAAAAELSRMDESSANGKRDPRRRYCSGGVLLNGKRMAAARMSLPPSRTSTTSSTGTTATSASNRKGTIGGGQSQVRQALCRQRSESSANSSLHASSSPNKRRGEEDGSDRLTPANSLKGLSEWRANQHSGQQECDWTLLEEETAVEQRLEIQQNPPRRHRRERQQQSTSFCGTFNDQLGRERGAIVPPEQVTYLHFLSSRQRRMQQLLEEEVKANRLVQFVKDADSFCYVDTLWKSLLASRVFHIPAQRAQSLFISSAGSKSDMFAEAGSSARQTLSSLDMEPFDIEALLRVICIESVAEKEPRVAELLRQCSWSVLCRFLVQFYESERRCRYFENSTHSHLVITNPHFLDSAALFRHTTASGTVEFFLLFKQCERQQYASDGRRPSELFANNAITKLLEEVISSLCAFNWANLLLNPPSLA